MHRHSREEKQKLDYHGKESLIAHLRDERNGSMERSFMRRKGRTTDG
jgi:hypothetical protein